MNSKLWHFWVEEEIWIVYEQASGPVVLLVTSPRNNTMICTDFCPILWPVGIKNIVADEYSNLLFTCFSIASWCIVLTESNSIGYNIHLLQYFWYRLLIRSDKSRCIWITWLFYYVVTSQKSICYCSLFPMFSWKNITCFGVFILCQEKKYFVSFIFMY